MNRAPLLDTHAWVSWMERDGRFDSRTFEALDAFALEERPYVCDISLWEVAMAVELKRLALTLPLQEWLSTASHPRTVRVVSISPAIAADTAMLPSSFHRDPADRIIVSTCRVMGLSIMTRDRLILRSRLVTRWKPA